MDWVQSVLAVSSQLGPKAFLTLTLTLSPNPKSDPDTSPKFNPNASERIHLGSSWLWEDLTATHFPISAVYGQCCELLF